MERRQNSISLPFPPSSFSSHHLVVSRAFDGSTDFHQRKKAAAEAEAENRPMEEEPFDGPSVRVRTNEPAFAEEAKMELTPLRRDAFVRSRHRIASHGIVAFKGEHNFTSAVAFSIFGASTVMSTS